MKNEKIKKSIERELVELGVDLTDCKIDKEDFDTTYAKSLANDDKRLKSYKKRIIADYNRTHNTGIFLSNLKVIAIAEKKMSEIAKNTNLERSSVYKILSDSSNPSVNNFMKISENLGINFVAHEAIAS